MTEPARFFPRLDTTATPADGDTLVYDAGANLWGFGAPPSSTVLVHDTFSDGTFSTIVGTTPAPVDCGTTWQLIKRQFHTQPDFTIAMNESADGHIGVDALDGNVTISADVNVVSDTGGAYGGVMGRMSLNHGIYCYISPGSDVVVIALYSGGSSDSAGVTISVGSTYNVKMKLDGADVTGWVDGVELVGFTMSGGELTAHPITDTVHGVIAGNGNDNWKWDNFIITDP